MRFLIFAANLRRSISLQSLSLKAKNVMSSPTNVNVFTEKATFAMACFWCPDPEFGVTPGVIQTRVGYSGGTKVNPTYKDLGDHTETIDIDYDPKKTSYSNLLKVFWKNHDPTAKNTRQYISIIFYHDDEQKALAEKTLKEEKSSRTKPITTQILPAGIFYNAEDYHQKYYLQTYHPKLITMLGVQPGDMAGSHVCARLNGYVTLHGSLKDFKEEQQELGLTSEQADYVINVMETGGTPGVCTK